MFLSRCLPTRLISLGLLVGTFLGLIYFCWCTYAKFDITWLIFSEKSLSLLVDMQTTRLMSAGLGWSYIKLGCYFSDARMPHWCVHTLADIEYHWIMSHAIYSHSTSCSAWFGWSRMPLADIVCHMCTCHTKCMQDFVDSFSRLLTSVSWYAHLLSVDRRIWTMLEGHILPL